MSTNNTTILLPDQRVSDKERKNPEWYIPNTDFIINKAISLNTNSKASVLSNLKAAEGIIENDTYDYVTKAFGVQSGDINLPTTVRKVSVILPIKRRYIGEYIRQYKNFQVYHKDTDAVKQRNATLANELEQLVAQQLVNFLNENNFPTGGQSKPVPNVDSFIKDFESNWFDDKVIESQKILSLFDELTGAETNYIKAFYYYWATDEVYSYRRVIGNEVHKEIINPLECYRIPSGNMFVEDDDMFVRRYMMSFNQINEQFSDELSDSDKIYLRSLENFNSTNTNKVNVLDSRLIEFIQGRDEYKYLSSLPDFNSTVASTNDLARFCWVHHVVFKSECKIGRLTYIDPLGTLQVKYVDETYKLNKEAGDLDIEWEWISRFYQNWRFGDQYTGIYTKPKLVEPQRQDINLLSKCKSPYNGITGTFDPNVRNSICELLKPYEALYRIYTYQEERAIAKYRAGLTLIPESLIAGNSTMSREQRLKFAKRDDTLYVNDSDINPNSAQLLRFVGSPGTEAYIKTLNELKIAIKNEAMEIADMNSQRFGDINQSAGKGVVNEAISKAQTGSILMFTLFNKFVETDKEADIDYAKVAWINGKQGSYMDKKTNKIVYVDVDGDDLFNRNIGIFCANSSVNDEKLQQFRNVAFNASQGGDYDIAADAIELENSTEIHKLIKQAVANKRQFEKEMKDRELANMKAIEDQKSKDKQADLAERKYESDNSTYATIEAAKIRAGGQINVATIKTTENIDKKITDMKNKEEELLNGK